MTLTDFFAGVGLIIGAVIIAVVLFMIVAGRGR